MRWIFLLLLTLNAFYYIWHQQEAPLRAKEVMPLALHRASGQDIRLLRETEGGHAPAEAEKNCLYIGGLTRQEEVRAVEQRLNSLDIHSQFQAPPAAGPAVYWLKILPESRRLVGDGLLDQLIRDFPQLKNKIMSCESIASAA